VLPGTTSILAGVSSGVRPRRLLVLAGTSRLSPGFDPPVPVLPALERLADAELGCGAAAAGAFLAADFLPCFFVGVLVVTSTGGSGIACAPGAGCGAS